MDVFYKPEIIHVIECNLMHSNIQLVKVSPWGWDNNPLPKCLNTKQTNKKKMKKISWETCEARKDYLQCLILHLSSLTIFPSPPSPNTQNPYILLHPQNIHTCPLWQYLSKFCLSKLTRPLFHSWSSAASNHVLPRNPYLCFLCVHEFIYI